MRGRGNTHIKTAGKKRKQRAKSLVVWRRLDATCVECWAFNACMVAERMQVVCVACAAKQQERALAESEAGGNRQEETSR